MIGIRKIDVKYAHAFYDCTRFIMEWQNEEGITVSNIVPKDNTFDIEWENNGYLKEIDYFNNRRSETTLDSDCDGICIPLPGNNHYGDQTITIEFTDGTVITYNLPEQGDKMLRDLTDYMGSHHEVVPSRSEMAVAARLLDDDMVYEI